jgi:hypothetical protein
MVTENWNDIANLFQSLEPIKQECVVYKTDRQANYESTSLYCFSKKERRLEKGNLADLKYQDITIQTTIESQVRSFLNGSDFLGLLIGPTGCGKTYQMLKIAKSSFTVLLDAQDSRGSNDMHDASLSTLKGLFESSVQSWDGGRNKDLQTLRRIAYAFVLSRMMFLKVLREIDPQLSPVLFLMHQLMNSRAVQNCFLQLNSLDFKTLVSMRNRYIDFEITFCVDEAHVLVEHLGDMIITSSDGNHLQANGDVNDDAKRGTLSVLLWAIKECEVSTKVIFAGTSRKLRNIDYFGTHETKPLIPVVLSKFAAWDKFMALDYVSSLVNISRSCLQTVLQDNYRPRVLENFVYDLFSIAMNDMDSPKQVRDKRIANKYKLTEPDDIVQESYQAILHRFTRVTIEPLSKVIRISMQTELMLKLLLSSMLSSTGKPINCHMDERQTLFFEETVGAIYIIPGETGYSFFEGYVIESFLHNFENELQAYNLTSSFNLLRVIINLEGGKTFAKGTPFEAVVIQELVKLRGLRINDVVRKFGIEDFNDLDVQMPTVESTTSDEEIIANRPTNTFFRPTNQFRPDIVAFLGIYTCLSFGIKIYTSKISKPIHDDNLASTDPALYFQKNGRPTNMEKRKQWKASTKAAPILHSIRFLIELPCLAEKVKFDDVNEDVNGKKTVIIMISKSNMHKLFSPEACNLIEFITGNL